MSALGGKIGARQAVKGLEPWAAPQTSASHSAPARLVLGISSASARLCPQGAHCADAALAARGSPGLASPAMRGTAVIYPPWFWRRLGAFDRAIPGLPFERLDL